MKLEEEIIPYFELVPGEHSSPQHQDDVSDDSFSDISYFCDPDMVEDYVFEH